MGILAAAEKPNIVLIMADDLGFADLGCYGSEIETPVLDSLAREGMSFTRFYNTAKCHSSRVCLLTDSGVIRREARNSLRGATLAEALKPAGYQTMMVGKWHLSKQPTDFGFDRYWGHLSGKTDFFVGDKTFRLDGEPWEVPEKMNGRRFYVTTPTSTSPWTSWTSGGTRKRKKILSSSMSPSMRPTILCRLRRKTWRSIWAAMTAAGTNCGMSATSDS